MGGKAVAQGSRGGVGARSRLGVRSRRRSWSKLRIRSRGRVSRVPLLPGKEGDNGDGDGVAGH